MTEAPVSLRHLTFACGDFTPVPKGTRYPGEDDDTYLAQGTPFLVKVRHRAVGGDKWGVVRAFGTVEECERAVASLRALHFVTEYVVFDLLQARDRREKFLAAGGVENGWSLKEEIEWGQQQPEPAPVGSFPYGKWTKVVPGVPAATI